MSETREMPPSSCEPLGILFVLPSLNAGGAERVVLNLIRNLDASRLRVTLFLFKPEGSLFAEVPKHVSVVVGSERGRLRTTLPITLARLVVQARRNHVIVGALELTATYLAYAAGRIAHKPVVGWVHTSLPNYLASSPRVATLVAQLFYRRLGLVVLPGKRLESELSAWVGGFEGESVVIANPFDPGAYLEDERDRELMAGLEAIFQRPVVIAVGRLIPSKGFDLLVAAHALLIRRGVNHHLLIVGEGEERARIEALRYELGVETTSFMPGFVRNPLPLLKKAQVSVLSSRYEGFGMVILEAMAAGTPVIATDCPTGPRDILEDGRSGVLVPNGDAEALASAIERLLGDPFEREHFRGEGSRRAQEFSASIVAAVWQPLLQRLANQGGQGTSLDHNDRVAQQPAAKA